MKKLQQTATLFLAFSFLLSFEKAFSQTNIFPSTGAAGIGTLAPNASSLLDVTSTTQGVLVPRMTKVQRDAIVAPATGLLIYQTNSTPGFYNYTGSAWTAVTPKAGANKFLDNLTAPTAVNVELLPAKDNTISLGSTISSWKDLYLDGSVYLGGSRFLAKNCGTGSFNTALGENTLFSNTTGYENTASGREALFSNTTGFDNTANGNFALYLNTTGNSNTANGSLALYSNTTGNFNTAAGRSALFSNTTGDSNTASGYASLSSNTTGDNNTASGSYSLSSNTTGNSNTAAGRSALFFNTTGYYNTANGDEALYHNTIGNSNTANGLQALYYNTTGNYNTASGREALYSNTTGYLNTAIGSYSLYSNTSGNYNTANGDEALYHNTIGNSNTANGLQALYYNTTGYYNTASGRSALVNNTTGDYNTAFGYDAGNDNENGSENSFFGSNAGEKSTTSGNTMIGYQAGDDNTTGTANTVVGRNSLSSTSASNCTVIGYGAGNDFTPGDNCTFLGYDADVTVAGLTNSTAIGNGALVIASNNMRFGNASVIGWGFGASPSTRAIKVGTAATNGNGAYLTVGGVWTDISDASKKENITELDKNLFLEKIQQLKISKWMYTGTRDEYHIGPMAQEFHKLFEVGDDSSISSMDKTGVLFLGVQALSEENEELKKKNEELEKRIAAIEFQSSTNNGMLKLATDNQQLTTAILGQNIPNPFDNTTLIPFRIPKNCHDASIMITNTSTSEVISVIPISCTEDHLSIDAGTLASGTYSYTLYVDGKVIGTKSMVLTR